MASKKVKLEQMNKENLAKWKGGYKQKQDRIMRQVEIEEMKMEGGIDNSKNWGSAKERQERAMDVDKMGESRFEDPLKRV